jgi:hypothetical protein
MDGRERHVTTTGRRCPDSAEEYYLVYETGIGALRSLSQPPRMSSKVVKFMLICCW